MKFRRVCIGVAAGAMITALSSLAAERIGTQANTGTTTLRPPVSLDTRSMKAMLRADRDKDGTLSRQELEHYDMTLAPRFREADGDRDGKLTLYEFEDLLAEPRTAVSGR